MLNGSKIWHEGNDGSGSGLDADKLDGLDSSIYAKVNKANTFEGEQKVNSNLLVEGDITLLNNGKYTGYIRSVEDGNIKLINKNGHSLVYNSNGDLMTEQDIVISSRSRWAGLRFSKDGVKKGIGFELDKGSGNLAFHNWDNDKTGFYFDYDTGTIEFSSAISIAGRKLYLTSSTPTGSRTTGDIWIA